MRITADTNILIRAIQLDDLDHARLAADAMTRASAVAIPLEALCEFAWVLRRGYRKSPQQLYEVMARLVESEQVITNRTAARAGLAILAEGGDFADGVIEHAGRELGGEMFVTFDRSAARLLQQAGHPVDLLATQR